jgi:hypothetical protein
VNIEIVVGICRAHRIVESGPPKLHHIFFTPINLLSPEISES